MRPGLRLAAVLSASVVAAVACSSSRSPVASSHDAPPTRRVVKIATLSPLSGEQRAHGEALMLGARLAVQQLGRGLGKNLAVELVPFDDQADLEVGVTAALRIGADPLVVAVIGPLNSDVALSVAPVFRGSSLAMISPSSTHAALTELDHRNVFRVCGRDDVQGDLGARFARDSLGAKTAWVAHDGTAYGRDIARFFEASARRRGMTIFGYDGVGDDISEALLAAMKAKKPDVLYYGGSYERAATLFKDARAAGVAAAFLGSDGIDSSELASRMGPSVVGVYYTSVAGPITVHPKAKEFGYDYKKAFRKKPEPFAVQAYDATAIALEAIAKAGADGALPTRTAVIAAIRGIRYVGYTGIIAFDGKGDMRQALYLVMKVSSSDPDDWDDNRELKRLAIAPPGR